MTKPEILTNVTAIVRSTLRLDPETEILPSTRLIADLGAESIDMLDLACEVEKVVHCELDFHKLLQEHREQNKPDDFTVQDIVDAVGVYMESNPAGGNPDVPVSAMPASIPVAEPAVAETELAGT